MNRLPRFSGLFPLVLAAFLFASLPDCKGDDGVLRLLVWTEYVPRPLLNEFSRRTGIRIEVENYNSNEQMVEMLRAMPDHYDLLQPSGFYVEMLAKRDELEPLDLAKIPNVKNLEPRFRHPRHDPDERFSVPWLAGTVGIVVNTERIKEPVRTWSDVFDGTHAGKIVIINDPREMVAWALASGDLPISDVSDTALSRIQPVLENWLPQVKVFDSDSPKTAMLDGSAEIGIVWSGEAAELWRKDRKFRYVLPAKGAHMFIDSLAIPRHAPHKLAAEEFINFCLEPEVSLLISNAYPYTNPNAAARRLLAPEQRENPASYPPGDLDFPSLTNVGNSPAAVAAFVDRLRKAGGGSH